MSNESWRYNVSIIIYSYRIYMDTYKKCNNKT